MNDTFSQDAWQKMHHMKQKQVTRFNQHHQQSNSEINSCFSNLARSQILLKNHNKEEGEIDNKFQPNFEQR